jgi:hypothetical protein
MSTENETEKNTVTISISEYNRLQAKDGLIQSLEQKLAAAQTSYTTLSTEFETVKNSKSKGPTREEIETQVRQELGQKIAEAETAKSDYERKYKTAVVTDKVLGVLKSNNLFPWATDYVKSTIEAECDLNGDVIIIKDETGQERWSDKTPNQKMGIEEYAEVLKNRKPELFESTAKQGAPDQGQRMSTNQKSTTLTWQDVDRMTPAELKKVPTEQLDALISQTPLR